MAGEVHGPWRAHAQGAFEPSDIPVGLRRRNCFRGFVGTPKPHRIDLHERAQRAAHRNDAELQCERFGRVSGKSGEPIDVFFRAAGPRELRVFLPPENHQVHGDAG